MHRLLVMRHQRSEFGTRRRSLNSAITGRPQGTPFGRIAAAQQQADGLLETFHCEDAFVDVI